jgi:hypothetical protein
MMLPLIGVDPGGTTGIVVLRVPWDWVFAPAEHENPYAAIEIVEYIQVPEDEAVAAVERLYLLIRLTYPGAFPLVLEDFVLRVNTASRDLLSPVRVNAAIEERMKPLTLVRVYKQMPSEAKGTVTNDRLRRWGMYRRGKPHSRDALRHGVHFLRRARESKKLAKEAWG